jgi:hypothetical protein
MSVIPAFSEMAFSLNASTVNQELCPLVSALNS